MKLVRVIGPDVLRIGLVQVVIDSLLQQRPPGFAYGIVTCTKYNNKETIIACGYHEHSSKPNDYEPSFEELERYFFDRELCNRETVSIETTFVNLSPRDQAFANLSNFVLRYRSLTTPANKNPNFYVFPALANQDRALIKSSLDILLSWLAFTDIIPDVQLLYNGNMREGNIEGCILRVYPNLPDMQVWLEEDAKLRAFLTHYQIRFKEADGLLQGNNFEVKAILHLADAVLCQCDVKPPMIFAFNAQDTAAMRFAEMRQLDQQPSAKNFCVSSDRPAAKL